MAEGDEEEVTEGDEGEVTEGDGADTLPQETVPTDGWGGKHGQL